MNRPLRLRTFFSIIGIFCWMTLAAQDGNPPKDESFNREVAELIIKGKSFLSSGNYDSASYVFSKGISLYEKMSKDSNTAIFYNNLGIAEYYKGNLSGSIESYEIASELYQSLGLKNYAAQTEFNLGLVYKKKGMLLKAYDVIIFNMDYFESTNNSRYLATGYNTLGNIQQQLGEFDRSISFHRKALNTRLILNDKKGISSSLNNLGIVYFEMELPDSALHYYYKALSIKKQLGNPGRLANTQILLGELHHNYGNIDSTSYYYQTALANQLKVGDPIPIASTLNRISELLIESGDLAASDSLLEKAWDLSSSNDAMGVMQDIAEVRIKWSESKQDAAKISEWNIIYRDINKKMVGLEKQEAIERLQIEFDVKRNLEALALEEQKSQLLEEKNAYLFRTNTLLTIGVVTLILLASALVYLLRVNRNKNRQLEKQGLILEQQANSIALLHKEYKHRTKNHFAIISAMFLIHKRSALASDPKELLNEYKGRVEALAMINRHLVREENQKEEVDMEQYLDELIQNTELGYSGDTEIEVIRELDAVRTKPDVAMKLGIVVNELMTNFFKYGISEDKISMLSIRTSSTEKDIQLLVSDNGPGLSNTPQQKKPGSGFGLNLINTFIEDLNGTVAVIDKNGLTVEISIPLK